MKSMQKPLVLIALAMTLPAFVGSCSAKDTRPLRERLESLERIESVEEIEQTTNVFEEKYMLTFTLPIEWDDPSYGTFPERVVFGFEGYDDITVYGCNGYYLYDQMSGRENYYSGDERGELAKMYSANSVSFEYRYFGKSVPEELSLKDAELWKHDTSKNASHDFYFIITQLSKILKGKSVFTGTSKGGLTTNTLAYYYPKACDVYVPYVAPNCNGLNDTRMAEFLNTVAGNGAYGETKAKQYRDAVLDFQVGCLECRDYMEDSIYQYVLDKKVTLLPFATKERIFEAAVSDTAVGTWQYYLNFSKFLALFGKSRDTEDEKKDYASKAISLLKSNGTPDGFNVSDGFVPYFIQAYMELGNYKMDFSYIRKVLKEKGEENLLYVTEAEEDTFFMNFYIPENLQESLSYSPSFHEELNQWAAVTKCHVVMIYGGLDPWSSVRIDDTDNKNILRYTVADKPHSASIDSLSASKKSECIAALNGWLGATAE